MKTFVIIGSTTGIGLSITQKLIQNNRVFGVSRREHSELNHTNYTHFSFDVLEDSWDTISFPEQIDGLVYCPGSIQLKPLKMLTDKVIREDMEINFFGAINCIKAVSDRLQQNSSILLFSTVAVQQGMPFHASISSAKGAIEGLTRSLAAEFAPKVRVNSIAPSIVDTPLAKRLLNNDRKRELISNKHPLKRVGEVEDISELACFLLSVSASWITGQIIGVDGGKSSISL
ncbi:MAG: oxidoreductase [Flavobacteriaceae bacterium]|nr:oxidoreductase [Flavobacteriaceae bacterium]OUX39161.1 MAG: oxidoreductase [Flavobacteriaceae bacterium TMED265]